MLEVDADLVLVELEPATRPLAVIRTQSIVEFVREQGSE
jgi:hypothetical protein